jgi:hypothetical protein
MRKWVISAAVVVAGLVGTIAVVGTMLPQGHRAQRTRLIARPQADVFATISDFARYPEWRSGVHRVTVDGAGAGALVREESDGETMTYRVEVFEPPSRLVMRIADDTLPFGGAWTYELRPAAAGTELTITEDGEVYNPIFRFLSRFVIGHHATIDRVLSDVAR